MNTSGMLYFRFGLPFVLYMERTVTWDALQKEILEKMRHLLRPGVYIQVGKGASRRRTNQESPLHPVIFLPTHRKPAELVTQWCE